MPGNHYDDPMGGGGDSDVEEVMLLGSNVESPPLSGQSTPQLRKGNRGGGGGGQPKHEDYMAGLKSEMRAAGAKRVLHSQAYKMFYIGVIVANFGALLWLLIDKTPESGWFVLLEIVVGLVFGTEILLKYTADPGKFWTAWSNKFDVFVFLLLVTGGVLYAVAPGSLSEEDEVGAEALLIFRYIYMLLRLGGVMKNTRSVAPRRDIVFNIGDDEDDDGIEGI